MDLNEILSGLMLDLKMTLDDEISTSEATRCVVRAVEDLSRKIPRERIYEHTWIKTITDDSFTTPATANATLIVNAITLNGESDGSTITVANHFLDVPRPLAFLITDANNSITRATITVMGTDADGVYREEKFYRHNGKSQTGKVYFYTVSQVILTEIGGSTSAADTISIGTAAPDTAGKEVWVQISNPIEPGSDGIYSAASKGGTKYTLNTDYKMDYSNGKICFLSAGSMAVSTTYYANYNRHDKSIDISGIIPELIRITKVIYPVDKTPEQSVAFSIWENMLTIGSPRTGTSQGSLVDDEHLAIYYEAKHVPPTEFGSGSYSENLDQIVLIGAGGYAMMIEAIQYELQAVTDLSTIRTELGLTTAVHTLITTALAKAAVLVTASSGKIDLALTKVALYLETNDATDNAKDVLANITDDVADLRTKVNTAVDAVATALGKVSTIDLDAATVGAVAWLLEGELTIDKMNDGGPNVAGYFADYARAKIQIGQSRAQQAIAYTQEAQLRLNNLRTYIEEAAGWMRMGEDFIAEAQTWIAEVGAIISEANSRIAQIDRYLAEAAQYQEVVANDMLLSDRFRAEAQIRMNEFNRLLDSKSEYRKRMVSIPVRQPA